MKKYFILLLLLISTVSNTQEVKKIKQKLKEGKAIYYVLKSDLKTKHGEYIVKNYKTKAITTKGVFSNGKKEGEWSEFRVYGSRKNLGVYKEDAKVGDWGFYNQKSKLIQIYNYDKNVLIWSKACETDKEYVVIINDEFVKSKLDCAPSCIGGIGQLKEEFIRESMKAFPPKHKDSIVVSYFTLILTKDGTIKNIKFPDERLKSEKIKRFLRDKIYSKKGQWFPASLNNNKLDSKLRIPFGTALRAFN